MNEFLSQKILYFTLSAISGFVILGCLSLFFYGWLLLSQTFDPNGRAAFGLAFVASTFAPYFLAGCILGVIAAFLVRRFRRRHISERSSPAILASLICLIPLPFGLLLIMVEFLSRVFL